jgi:hypothetical protein
MKTERVMKKVFLIALALSVMSVTQYPANAAENNPYGISTVDPAGPNEVIFTVSKGGKKTEFAYARIQKMKSKTISIYEPFLKKRQSFTVVSIKSFFDLVGIKGQDKVLTIALNDYIYTNTAAQFLAADAYIAIKRNGVDIPYDQGGPLRLVFADKSKWSKNLDAWNWSLASIRVK